MTSEIIESMGFFCCMYWNFNTTFWGQDQCPSSGLLLPKLCTNICFGGSLPEDGNRSCPQDAVC